MLELLERVEITKRKMVLLHLMFRVITSCFINVTTRATIVTLARNISPHNIALIDQSFSCLVFFSFFFILPSEETPVYLYSSS